jgi:hypothetical protein
MVATAGKRTWSSGQLQLGTAADMQERTDEAGRVVPGDGWQRAAGDVHVAARQDIAQRRKHALSPVTTSQWFSTLMVWPAEDPLSSAAPDLALMLLITCPPAAGVHPFMAAPVAHLQVVTRAVWVGEGHDSPRRDLHGLVEGQLHAQQHLLLSSRLALHAGQLLQPEEHSAYGTNA